MDINIIIAMVEKSERDACKQAEDIFRKHGGIMRTSEAIEAGIHPSVLYRMRDSEQLEKMCRGLYRLKELPALGQPDLVAATAKIPKGVVCLISALSFHEITTQIPHAVYCAIPRGTRKPRLDYPPVWTFTFSSAAYGAGIEEHHIEGVSVRIYSAEKTLADCFKYRNKIGIDTAVEALRFYRERKKPDVNKVIEYARVCRVFNVMLPYLEGIF